MEVIKVKLCTVYGRGGQSAALQRFSVAPVSNFGCTTQLFMKHLCMKIPKIYINLHLYVRKNKAKKIFVARNTIFQ